MSLIRSETHAADAEVLGRWRSLDPALPLGALALSAFGSLAVLYVAGEDAGQAYAADQTIGASWWGSPAPFLVLCVLSLGLLQSIAARSRAEVSKQPKV